MKLSPDKQISVLQHELQLRQFEIALLKETADAVSSQLHLDDVLQLIVERARTLIQAETVLIPVLNEECDTYTYMAGCGKDSEEIVGETLPLEFGICGWVWRHRRPWWHGVLDELDEAERNKWEHQAGTIMLVPLIGKHHFLGGLAGMNKIGGDDFNQRDLELLTMFATQVNVAIENAISYEALKSAKTEAESNHIELKSLNEQLGKANKELKHLALYDHLTDLPNRSLIQDRLQQGIFTAARNQKSLTIIMADLDQFKEINDTLGHHVGDQLLKEVGTRFKSALRKTDTVGRLGGDEFAVIVSDSDAEAAILLATDLLKTLEAPFESEGNNLSVAASLGIAVYPEHGEDVSTLLKHADVAMYAAKRMKNGYSIYEASEDLHSRSRLTRLSDLRHAVHNGELELYYQPEMDLTTGHITSVEALVRWPHPEQGLIQPKDFVPVMEQTGLIKPFAIWALDTALQQFHEWREAGIEVKMSVNLSMHNLRDSQLPVQLSTLLKRWSIKPGSLILEITESAMIGNPQFTEDVLFILAAKGVQFSIDDFGTGYSSLSHLKKLPVQELKIDGSFVMGMTNDTDDAVIVRSTIELAHNLGLRVIAEGVQDEKTANALIELGCDMGQGYYFCKPLPAEEIMKILSDDLPVD